MPSLQHLLYQRDISSTIPITESRISVPDHHIFYTKYINTSTANSDNSSSASETGFTATVQAALASKGLSVIQPETQKKTSLTFHVNC